MPSTNPSSISEWYPDGTLEFTPRHGARQESADVVEFGLTERLAKALESGAVAGELRDQGGRDVEGSRVRHPHSGQVCERA